MYEPKPHAGFAETAIESECSNDLRLIIPGLDKAFFMTRPHDEEFRGGDVQSPSLFELAFEADLSGWDFPSTALAA